MAIGSKCKILKFWREKVKTTEDLLSKMTMNASNYTRFRIILF